MHNRFNRLNFTSLDFVECAEYNERATKILVRFPGQYCALDQRSSVQCELTLDQPIPDRPIVFSVE
jgi:hypothetical protein